MGQGIRDRFFRGLGQALEAYGRDRLRDAGDGRLPLTSGESLSLAAECEGPPVGFVGR